VEEIEELPSADDASHKQRKLRSGLTIPWPGLALALAALSLAALGALVIVATIVDADALATVALVLAILAFGAQLIVTAAQTASANEQYRQVNRLYEDTRSVLQRIRTQSKMLLSNQSDQFNKILDHVLSPGAIESAVAEARGETEEPGSPNDDQPATTTTDVNEIAKLLRAQADLAFAEDRAKRAPTHTPRRSMPDAVELRQFPKQDEAQETVERYLSLSEGAKKYLQQIADRFNRSPNAILRMAQIIPGERSGLPPHLLELEASGFVVLEPIRREGKNNTGRRLTSQGVLAVRFFTGQGVVPAYLRGVVGEGGTA